MSDILNELSTKTLKLRADLNYIKK